ncbi:hypothetical protein HUA78_35950 [Myxococcus sp. CA033]|uniref:hypothetical protein n=1 Tax=Myxococcus sp. CA033 TaxID=2741516 RepID=UPI00157B3A2D|nr:hypothetical protein [Myxococcus sp. CA033]NTX39845.1 hypothetical protein [Myxococcus sp. CA033]
MTQASFKWVDLDRVFLPLVAVALQAIARCETRGVSYVATYGFRSREEIECFVPSSVVRAEPTAVGDVTEIAVQFANTYVVKGLLAHGLKSRD